MGKTNIEWATHNWNWLTWNCTQLGDGCQNCYALALANRYKNPSNGGSFTDYPPVFRRNALKELKRIPDGAIVFVNTMSDTFHPKVDIDLIDGMFQEMTQLPDVTFLVLTKRIGRVRKYQEQLTWGPNIWIGTSVESAKYTWRLDVLCEIEKAAGRFVSAEPLLGPIDLSYWLSENLDWVIVGGESGGNRRYFDKNWARDIRNSCVVANVPFFFKQGSAALPGKDRLLDGRTWNETPWDRTQVRLEDLTFQPTLL